MGSQPGPPLGRDTCWCVEERAETIERSEIVEVRTYPPCTRVCFNKTFPVGPSHMANKRFEIVMDVKPITYIFSVFCLVN